jgi:2'-deoxymugineic-acid 2'-dioxygenase/mugineic-acid 3-dioxygenase
MEKLLSSSSSSHKTVPGRFHLPPELRPPALAAAPVSLPVIDLSGSRDEVRGAVLRAGKEFGFFQVINHGVPERTTRELEAACVDFFRLPAADKAAFYSEDTEQTNRLFSSTMYESGAGESYWRD